MARYRNTKIGFNEDNGSFLRTTLYDIIKESDGDIWVMAQEGDRLDQLAHQFYGDPHLWWYIARANNLKFNNLVTGTKLRIPASKEFAKGS